MRRYETFVIIDPDLSGDQREPLIARVEELINQMDGFLVHTDDWGERKLAYDIKKKGRGYYVRFDYCGLAPLVNEIERFFRIDDRALKYMTVLLSGDADLEKIKAEKAAKETAEAEKVAAEAAAVQSPSDHDNATQESPGNGLTPAKENGKPDENVPPSDTDVAAAEKTPTATKEEA